MNKVDFKKLNELRDAHATLHADYKAKAERWRNAKAELAALRAVQPQGDSKTQNAVKEVLSRNVTGLESVTPDTLARLHIDARTIRRLIQAQHNIATLRAKLDAIAPRLAVSSALTDRLNSFVLHIE